MWGSARDAEDGKAGELVVIVPAQLHANIFSFNTKFLLQVGSDRAFNL